MSDSGRLIGEGEERRLRVIRDAAPELLEACKEALSYLRHPPQSGVIKGWADTKKMLTDAVAKAEGKS